MCVCVCICVCHGLSPLRTGRVVRCVPGRVEVAAAGISFPCVTCSAHVTLPVEVPAGEHWDMDTAPIVNMYQGWFDLH